MGSSTSKYSDCNCLDNIQKNRQGDLNCMSIDGHKCICNYGSSYHHYYKHCKANLDEHFCICFKNGSLNCKSIDGHHSCTCFENLKLKKQHDDIKCKAKRRNHVCLCNINKKECLFIHHE
jgi:hypothetical protein